MTYPRIRKHLEPSLLAAYSKLCTILISQGRIRADFQDFVIDCLGSDDEKEEFLRKFRIGNQLVKVLVKKRNHGEAFSKMIANGRVEEAFHFGLEHMREDSEIAPKEVINLLHNVAFKHLLKILPGTVDKGSPPWPVDLSLLVPAEVLYAIGEWNSLFLKLQKHSLKEIVSDLESGLHRDLVSITVRTQNSSALFLSEFPPWLIYDTDRSLLEFTGEFVSKYKKSSRRKPNRGRLKRVSRRPRIHSTRGPTYPIVPLNRHGVIRNSRIVRVVADGSLPDFGYQSP